MNLLTFIVLTKIKFGLVSLPVNFQMCFYEIVEGLGIALLSGISTLLIGGRSGPSIAQWYKHFADWWSVWAQHCSVV